MQQSFLLQTKTLMSLQVKEQAEEFHLRHITRDYNLELWPCFSTTAVNMTGGIWRSINPFVIIAVF